MTEWLGSDKETKDIRLGVFDYYDDLVGYAELEWIDPKEQKFSYWRDAYGKADLDAFRTGMKIEDIVILKRGVALPEL